jgi:hypothetical protein
MLSSQQVDSQHGFLCRHKYGRVRLHPAQETVNSESLLLTGIRCPTGPVLPVRPSCTERQSRTRGRSYAARSLLSPSSAATIHQPPPGTSTLWSRHSRENPSRCTAAKTRSPAMCGSDAETSIWHTLYNLGPPALSSLKIRLSTRKCPLLSPLPIATSPRSRCCHAAYDRSLRPRALPFHPEETHCTAPEGIRTPDLRIRNPLLYPTELRAQNHRAWYLTGFRAVSQLCGSRVLNVIPRIVAAETEVNTRALQQRP